MKITRSLISWRHFHGKNNIHSALRSFGAFLSWSAILTLPLSTASSSFAGSAGWKANPANGDWNTATNWMPATVPNGPSDTATFATSSQTTVSLSANTEVNTLFYRPGANAFTTTLGNALSLTLSGAGIVNHSGVTQNFQVTAIMQFTNSATAGRSTNFAVGNSSNGGNINFLDTSSAGSGVFSGVGLGTVDFSNSSTAANGIFTFQSTESAQAHFRFFDGSTAGSSTFTTNGSVVGAFNGNSSAGNSLLTINGAQATGGGFSSLAFSNFSTAGAATLVANGGSNGGFGGAISFNGPSTGGTSRVEVFGNGTGLSPTATWISVNTSFQASRSARYKATALCFSETET